MSTLKTVDSPANQIGTIENSRSQPQEQHMRNTVGAGKCPFCDLNLVINKVIWEGRFWRAWFNPFPYTYHAAHLVVAAKDHWVHLWDIPEPARLEWFDVNIDLIRRYNLPGGGIVMRFTNEDAIIVKGSGTNQYNAGTLSHIHSHVQVPDCKGPAIAVFFKDESLSAYLANLNNPKK